LLLQLELDYKTIYNSVLVFSGRKVNLDDVEILKTVGRESTLHLVYDAKFRHNEPEPNIDKALYETLFKIQNTQSNYTNSHVLKGLINNISHIIDYCTNLDDDGSSLQIVDNFWAIHTTLDHELHNYLITSKLTEILYNISPDFGLMDLPAFCRFKKLDINTIVDEELQTITIDNISSENFSDNEWFFLQYLANNSEFYFNPSSYFIKILNSHEQLIKEAISLELISFDSLVELTEKIDPCYFRALISSLPKLVQNKIKRQAAQGPQGI